MGTFGPTTATILLMAVALAGCTSGPANFTVPEPANTTGQEGLGPEDETTSPATMPSNNTTTPPPSNNTTAPPPPAGYVHVPSIRDWGDPEDALIRPGVDIVGGGQCTTNFLYHLNDERYFVGAAAHCFENEEGSQFYETCPAPAAMEPGVEVRVYDRLNEVHTATLVYNSFWTMDQVEEEDEDICGGNDFALAEISPSDFETIHPAVLGWGGPTATSNPQQYLVPGDNLFAYGNSDNKGTWLFTGEGFTSRATFKEYSDGGWGVQAGPATPPLVPGDSGGPVMGPNGEAIGALSILETLEGDVRWTNIGLALRYMQENVGWHPSIVTWDEFSTES